MRQAQDLTVPDARELFEEIAKDDSRVAVRLKGLRVEREHGDVIAFAGLTLQPTEHRMQFEGRTLHTWCAFDTLFLSVLLGKDAEITSRDPARDEPVRFRFGPGGYAGSGELVMSLVRTSPKEMRENVRAAFCHSVYFFRDVEAAAPYLEEHPDLVTIPMADALMLARRWNETLYGEALAS